MATNLTDRVSSLEKLAIGLQVERASAMAGTAVEWLTMFGEWGIVIAILYEGRLAFQEYRTARLFEMLNHLERSGVREARHVVFTKIASKDNKGKRWWKDNQLHVAAANLAASYDHLGLMIKVHGMGSAERMILERWGESIVRSHEVLDDFLKWRRETGPQAYAEYTAIYRLAKEIYPDLPPPSIEGEEK